MENQKVKMRQRDTFKNLQKLPLSENQNSQDETMADINENELNMQPNLSIDNQQDIQKENADDIIKQKFHNWAQQKFEEVKIVYEHEKQFEGLFKTRINQNSNIQNQVQQKKFPEKIFIIDINWYQKWQDYVHYFQFKKKYEQNLDTQYNKPNISSGNQFSFFGNWNNQIQSNLKFSGNSLGSKIENENSVQKQQQNTKIEEIRDLDFNDLYNFDEDQKLLNIKLPPIQLTAILEPQTNYLFDQNLLNDFSGENHVNQQVNKFNVHNFPLKSSIKNMNIMIIPQQIWEILSKEYGVENDMYQGIQRFQNEKCESWDLQLNDRYLLRFEEVNLLFYIPVLGEGLDRVVILDQNGAYILGGINNTFKLSTNSNIPPPPSNFLITPPPPKIFQKQKFPFILLRHSIQAQKFESIQRIKQRIASSLQKSKAFENLQQFLKKESCQIFTQIIKESDIRIWRYQSDDKCINLREIGQKLGHLFKSSVQNINQLSSIEENTGITFPGMNMDIVESKLISELNQKFGGVLCRENELIFVEIKRFQDDQQIMQDKEGFTFRFSNKKEDYSKCQMCQNQGLIQKVYCICQKVNYCSQLCLDKDINHQNSCSEIKKRESDPNFFDFKEEQNALNGLVGLKNLGNTCYMNSALQCLSHTMPLLQYFVKDMIFKRELNKNNPDASINNQITLKFSKFLNQMWNKAHAGLQTWDKTVFNPMELKYLIGQKNDMFKGYEQNDSQEFLQFLLDQLHEDLNRVEQKPKIFMPSEQTLFQLSDEQISQLFREAYLKQNQSVIVDLMIGQNKTIIKCLNCKNISRKIWHFMVLPIQIGNKIRNSNYQNGQIISSSQQIQFQNNQQQDEAAPGGVNDQIQNQQKVQQNFTLQQCISKSLDTTILQNESAYECLNCQSKQTAEKTHRFHSLPPILILSIQRFKDGQKNNDKIIFPIKDLKMSKFIEQSQSQLLQQDDHNYDLYAVINHSGSLNFGHYYAYCFNQKSNQWHEFNDSFVKPITDSDLHNQMKSGNPYILFYKKKNFELKNSDDFEQIKQKSTGSCDNLFEEAKSNQDQILINNTNIQQKQTAKGNGINHLDMAQDADMDDLQQIQFSQINDAQQEYNQFHFQDYINPQIKQEVYNQISMIQNTEQNYDQLNLIQYNQEVFNENYPSDEDQNFNISTHQYQQNSNSSDGERQSLDRDNDCDDGPED